MKFAVAMYVSSSTFVRFFTLDFDMIIVLLLTTCYNCIIHGAAECQWWTKMSTFEQKMDNRGIEVCG